MRSVTSGRTLPFGGDPRVRHMEDVLDNVLRPSCFRAACFQAASAAAGTSWKRAPARLSVVSAPW